MSTDCSNNSIIQNLVGGDTTASEKAWSCILNKCTTPLNSYLRTRGVQGEDDRADITYESIYRMIKILKSGFEIKRDVCAILMGVGKNVHQEHLRKQKKDHKLEETYSDVLNSLEPDDRDYSSFQNKFNQLGDKCKMLLDLKYVQGLKMSEMAEILDRTSTGIKTDIQVCKNKLRKLGK